MRFYAVPGDVAMNKNGTIPVFAVCDREYFPFAVTAFLSVLGYTDRKIQFHIIHVSALPDQERRQADTLIAASGGGKIIYTQLQTDHHYSSWTKRFPPLVFIRLLLPEMFPMYDRGIYLDSDILVERDIGELFDLPMGDRIIGAVPEKYWKKSYELNVPLDKHFQGMGIKDYYRKAGFLPENQYYNSGVLLLDMKKAREAGVGDTVRQHAGEDLLYPDQDLLNFYLHDKIFELDGSWNNALHPEEIPSGQILHYIDKPWRNSSANAIRSHYWQALRKTPWFYRARAELILYEIEASVNSIWRDPKDNVLTAFLRLGIEFAAALIRRAVK